MQKLSLYITFALLLAMCATNNSCTKSVSGINNNEVVETPYSLFFSDTSGALFSSNDGKTVRAQLFRPDGFPCRAICVDNNNILWAKTNLYISIDNGINFNQAYDSLASYPFRTCDTLVKRDLNQSMIINLPDWNTAFTVSSSPVYNNYLGVVFNLNAGGIRGYWWFDVPDTAVPPSTTAAIGNYGASYPVTMTTFTYLKNGTLCGYDAVHNRNFYRMQHTLWREVTANPDSLLEPIGNPSNRSGNRLPHRDVHYPAALPSGTDTGAWYSYGHYNSRLIAIDNRNCTGNGAYYSDDNGRNWTQYSGLPAKPLLCISSPFEELCLIGTENGGLYFLNNNTNAWQLQTNNGLGTNIVIRNIAFKQNIFKNGSVQKYVYLATNRGIYQSTNGGYNWTLTIPGNFVAVY